ncbi:MAG: DPP IV N-terminal domain-containing protein [Anaerolineae bacterium]
MLLKWVTGVGIGLALLLSVLASLSAVIGAALPYQGEIRYILHTSIVHIPYTLDAQRGLALQLREPLPASSAQWSPDNQHIIAWFGSATYVTRLRGDALHYLSGNRVFPVWSADGRYLTFETFTNTFGRVFIASGDGTDVTPVLPDERIDYSEPRFSPDSTRLAFIGGSDLYVMNLADGRITRLTNTETQRESQPLWSPDGQQLAYLWHLSSTNNQLSLIAADGQNRRDLTDSPSSAVLSPRWSPDSSQLVYLTGRAERTAVYVVAASGGEPRQLTVTYPFTTTDAQVAWMNDGRRVQVTWTNVANGITISDDTLDAATGELLSREVDTAGTALLSPDGRWQAFVENGRLCIQPLASADAPLCHTLHAGVPLALTWLP